MSNTLYRLGTANMYDNALRNLGARQTNLSNLQENLTSGKRVVRASDDPVSAAQAERALTRLTRIQTEQRAWKPSATPSPRPNPRWATPSIWCRTPAN